MSTGPYFEVYSTTTEVEEGPAGATYSVPKTEWRWRLKAENGEIVAVGESYTRKSDAMRAIMIFKRLAPIAEIQEVEE